jgi:hypothetical protein
MVDKIEIAKRQIDAAIREHFTNNDPIVIATLTSPASQILRDLNRNNKNALSDILTDIAIEAGESASALWKHWNESTGANKLKHGNINEKLDVKKLNSEGAISFCILEYRAANRDDSFLISHHMYMFLKHQARWNKVRQTKKQGFRSALLQSFERRFVLFYADTKMNILKKSLKTLIKMQDWVDKRKAQRSLSEP